ncbi:hypothetical protein GCM10025777_16340 [Membranihabitans marinus]
MFQILIYGVNPYREDKKTDKYIDISRVQYCHREEGIGYDDGQQGWSR